jgi:hypothetical protein
MKVLLFGAGSKWGAHLTKYMADQGCIIDLVSSSNFHYNNVNTISVDWNLLTFEQLKEKLLPLSNNSYDLIFFNQNRGGVPNDKFFTKDFSVELNHWNKSYWIDCQLPYYVIKFLSNSIRETTKIGWMLTGLITSTEQKHWKYAGYAGEKNTNLHIMRGFSQYHPGIFFCINPIWFPEDQIYNDCIQIYSIFKKLAVTDNSKIINKDGTEWNFFKKIH